MSDDNDDLLAVLNSHGQQFLSSFAPLDPASQKRKGAPTTGLAPSPKRARSESSDSEEAEWAGFGSGAGAEVDSSESGDEDSGNEGDEELIDGASEARFDCTL